MPLLLAHVHVQTEEEKQQLKGRISALLANAPPLLKPEWVQDKRKFQASQTNLNRVSQRSVKTDRTNRFPRKLTTVYYEQHLASHAVNRTFKQSVIALERHRQKRLNLLIDTLDTGAGTLLTHPLDLSPMTTSHTSHPYQYLSHTLSTFPTYPDQENNSGDDNDNDNDSLDAGGSIGPASPLHDKPAGNNITPCLSLTNSNSFAEIKNH